MESKDGKNMNSITGAEESKEQIAKGNNDKKVEDDGESVNSNEA